MKHVENRKIEFYTDGAYSSRSQMGGWAVIIVRDDRVDYMMSGYEPYTTNNRMELMAFLGALEHIETCLDSMRDMNISIITDSAYISNCFKDKWYMNWMRNGWRTSDRQAVKNQDLWTRIVALYIKIVAEINIDIVKVASHTGNKYNEMADELAVMCRKKLEEADNENPSTHA